MKLEDFKKLSNYDKVIAITEEMYERAKKKAGEAITKEDIDREVLAFSFFVAPFLMALTEVEYRKAIVWLEEKKLEISRERLRLAEEEECRR